MSRLILHIGMPKAGSSAIQDFCDRNADQLAEAGLRWSAGRRGSNQAELAVAFSDRRNAISASFGVSGPHDEHHRRRLRDQIGRRLRSELNDDRPVLVSSEHLSSMLRSEEEIAELARFLSGFTDHITVVGVIRRADHWLPSAYTEAVRSGRDVALDGGFVRRRAHLLDHHHLLDRWVSTFGADAVRLIAYLETDRSDPATLPRRLLRSVQVDPDRITPEPGTRRLSRAGLSGEAVAVLRRIYPQLGADLGPTEREHLVQLLAGLFPGPGMRLTRAADSQLRKNGWIRTGIDREPAASGPGWDEWVQAPDAPTAPPPKVSEEQVERALTAVREAHIASRHPIRRILRRVRR